MMNVFDLSLFVGALVCYDDAADEVAADEAAAAVDEAGDIKAPDGFTPEQQKKFNEVLASERRKHEAKLKQELQKRETTYTQLLQNKNLTEKDRNSLQEQLDVVQGQLRTEKNQATEKIKEIELQWQGKLTALEKRANEAEVKYRESTIKRALHDAAVAHDAFRPEQVVTLLNSMTKLVDDKVVLDFPDEDATTGEPILTTRSAEDAVKRMKEKPEIYGNLFRNNVVSGIGSNSATGGITPGANGKVDVRKLTPQQYRELRAKNPELLGLGPRAR